MNSLRLKAFTFKKPTAELSSRNHGHTTEPEIALSSPLMVQGQVIAACLSPFGEQERHRSAHLDCFDLHDQPRRL